MGAWNHIKCLTKPIPSSSTVYSKFILIIIGSIILLLITAYTNVSQSLIGRLNYYMEYTENMDFGNWSYKAYWIKVEAEGNLVQRTSAYNKEISTLREKLLSDRKADKWNPLSNKIKTLRFNMTDDILSNLSTYPRVKTVSLSWQTTGNKKEWDSRTDDKNILIKEYHSWTGCEYLCDRIRNPGLTKYRDYAKFNRSCSELIDGRSLQKQSLEIAYFNVKRKQKKENNSLLDGGSRLPDYFYKISTPLWIFYLHIVEDGVITKLGDVLSGNLKLLPNACRQGLEPKPPSGYEKSPLYDEVFVISQFWGYGYFHFMLEDLTRIAPHLEFLQENPNILIHVQSTKGFTAEALKILKIDRSRLIAGTARAIRVYLPQGTPCGETHVQSAQLLSHHFNNYVQNPYQKDQNRSIVLIRRSRSRRFVQHSDLKRELVKISKEYGLDFEMFVDNPPPSMEGTVLLFRRAVLVVAPHGAGLSNILFCKPGALVLEGLCDPPHGNLCFQHTAHVLGHHYHGISAQKDCKNSLDIDFRLISQAARRLLDAKFKLQLWFKLKE